MTCSILTVITGCLEFRPGHQPGCGTLPEPLLILRSQGDTWETCVIKHMIAPGLMDLVDERLEAGCAVWLNNLPIHIPNASCG